MTDLPPGEPAHDGEGNRILSWLLERLDEVLDATAADSAGLPLFAVEAKLNGRLRAALPGVRFPPEDIKKWAARISS